MADVLLRGEVVGLLGGRHALDRALAAGEWQRVLRGTYASGRAADDLRLRAAAAARLLPQHAVVADRCLLWLLGVDVLPPGTPVLEVVVPRDAVVPRRRDLHARTADVAAQDVVRLGPQSVPCLRPVRAVADLLRMLPLVEAVVVADAAQHSSLTDVRALQEELRAHAGLRGVVQARRALEQSDPRAESPPESRLRLALRGAGLVPVPQFEVLDAQGRLVARVDLALPESRLALEHDGKAVHDRADAFVADRAEAERPGRRGLDGAALHGPRPAPRRRTGGRPGARAAAICGLSADHAPGAGSGAPAERGRAATRA